MNHPMQPTAEQEGQWLEQAARLYPAERFSELSAHIARSAYAAGADAELEGCCQALQSWGVTGIERLRAKRRPAPQLRQDARAVFAAARAEGRISDREHDLIVALLGLEP